MDTRGNISQEKLAARRAYVQQSPRSPVTVFHHIPKCGGTSVLDALANWFMMVPDYGSGWTGYYPKKLNTDSLRSAHCLCGHFELEGNHLHQRYPEVFTSNRFRVITFVRDPLQVKLSLFRYEKENNVLKTDVIEDHLLSRPNYIADRFPATLDNYREIIDRYFFVGILEKGQACLDNLARVLDKPEVVMPWKNDTRKDNSTNMGNISSAFLERFREDNALDYLIYDYCTEKFRQSSQ
ncbi:MAG TPA: hypothetical protein ENI62_08195 [Gammaproteobacteria bacterium]|nr:hypothetical protein [Gammaproteobacteria bacterium]